MSLACLDTLVGLSKSSYACFSDDEPDGFDTSTSGYHLTDPDYGLAVIDQCQTAGWTMLETARAQAIREVQNELRALLRSEYDSAFAPFSGDIGKKKSTAAIQMKAGKDHIVLRIRVPRQARDMYLSVKGISVGLDTSGTYTIRLNSNDPEFVEDTFSVVAGADEFTAADVDQFDLPLWTESSLDDKLEYYFAIELPPGVLPLNNLITCCGNSPSWTKVVEVAGTQSDVKNPETGSFSSYAHGFVVNGFVKCNELDWLCKAEELGGYHLLDVVARTIQFRGAAIAHSMLLETLKVNPCTGYNLEAMYAKRASLNKRSAENLQWLAENFTTGLSGCFTCKNTRFFTKKAIKT